MICGFETDLVFTRIHVLHRFDIMLMNNDSFFFIINFANF